STRLGRAPRHGPVGGTWGMFRIGLSAVVPIMRRSSMAAHQRHSWWGLAVVAALATACSNSTGPQAHLASPQQLSSDLQAVSGVFQSTAFQGFGAIGTATGSPATVTTPAGPLP